MIKYVQNRILCIFVCASGNGCTWAETLQNIIIITSSSYNNNNNTIHVLAENWFAVKYSHTAHCLTAAGTPRTRTRTLYRVIHKACSSPPLYLNNSYLSNFWLTEIVSIRYNVLFSLTNII